MTWCPLGQQGALLIAADFALKIAVLWRRCLATLAGGGNHCMCEGLLRQALLVSEALSEREAALRRTFLLADL